MNILFITRRIDENDAQTGFVHTWVKKFAKLNGIRMNIICLEKGDSDGLGENVEVFSMGKEKGKNRIREFLNFQRGAFRFMRESDVVFCHMNPIYTILIAPWAKLYGKKIVSWYSHKAINWQVRLMHLLADKVVTPTQESFGILSQKKIVVGHGIDVERFKSDFSKKDESVLRIVSVGRISPIKNYETLIKAVSILKKKISHEIVVDIIGGLGLNSQSQYFEEIKSLVKEKGLENVVNFLGAIPNKDLPGYYQRSDFSVNLCPTGSPDKAVLESMACGVVTLACNRTFVDDFGKYSERLLFKEKDPIDLAKKISYLFEICDKSEKEAIGRHLIGRVNSNHNLDHLVLKLKDVFEKVR